MRVVRIVVAAALVACVNAAAQAPPPPPPVFGVGVDMVAVDASVVDAEGRPVLGLGAGDFRVEVDGRPRRLVSVEYVGRELEPETPPPPAPAHYSTNEATARGRLVLLLVDRGNIGRGGGREVVKAADRFLDSLAPADRVGLSFVPGPGRSIEFTRDVDEVRRGLVGVVGTAERGGYRVPLTEAINYVRGRDPQQWNEFVDLTCGAYGRVTDSEACIQQLQNEAGQVYLAYRERSLATQRAIGSVLEGLKRIEGPKTVVLISEGLGTESTTEVRSLAVAAAEAQATLFVLLLDTSGPDPEFRRSEYASPQDRDIETAGLYDLAGLARGTVLRVVAGGDAAFRRIERELMGYYLLGFEPEGGDRDGRSHSVKVAVSRPGTTVRARGLLNIPASAPTPEALLASALRSPLVDRGLPVKVAAYALPGSAGKVRLLLSAEAGRASSPVSVGFALLGKDGAVKASRAYQGISGGAGDRVEFTAEVSVDPETYTLRLAFVDSSGRRGSVEHTVKAALITAGGIGVSDLVLAPAGAPGAVRPAVDLEVKGGDLSASLELTGSDATRLAAASVVLELAESEAGPPLLRVPVEPFPEKDGKRLAQVRVVGGLLPPGDYHARASVSVAGEAVASVGRPFRVLPAPAGSSTPSAPLAALLSEAPPFDRALLLDPKVLLHFIDRVAALVPGPEPAAMAAARADAREGRPEAILDKLDAGRPDARTAFLRGVSFYARGNLPAALTQLRTALGLGSQLFPAAVYAGGCYAAGGKDLDAIGAWQAALVGETGSPVVYALLGDALVRAREAEQAVAILDEGLAAFPEDPGLRRRLAMAHAMAGHRAEALPLLTAWVEAHPQDTGALFATMALLFEGFTRETASAAPTEDRTRLVRYARAYVEGKGPNREVVERWLRYLESRPSPDHS
jgi:VWFA-related protein